MAGGSALRNILILGKTYSRLKVLEHKGSGIWLCQCTCSNRSLRLVSGHAITHGKIKSCGCHSRDMTRTHGWTGTVEYQAWLGMRARCNRPRHPAYPDYGGRGIKVCAAWNAAFLPFLAVVGPSPGKGYSLGRINNDGDYEPGNVAWQHYTEQNRNKRDTWLVEFGGRRECVAQWERLTGLSVRARLTAGWSIEEALTIPKATNKTPAALLRENFQLQKRVLELESQLSLHGKRSDTSIPEVPPTSDRKEK